MDENDIRYLDPATTNFSNLTNLEGFDIGANFRLSGIHDQFFVNNKKLTGIDMIETGIKTGSGLVQ